MDLQRVRSLVVVAVAIGLLAGGCRSTGPAEPPAAAAPAPTAAQGEGVVPEAFSLLGEPLVRPALPAEVRAERERQLAEAQARLEADPGNPDAAIWTGRRLGYLGRYREAVAVFSRGLERHPEDPRFYRHRGHRFLTLRRLDLAEADLERAGELVHGRPDEVEPDGMPNALGIPTSTLQSNVWYHLGLARYLQGDFERALDAYRECLGVSGNPDMLVATSHWLYMTLSRLGREEEARAVLDPIHAGLEVIENQAYHRLLLLYRGELAPEALLAEASEAGGLDFATVAYGVGNWHLYNGRGAEAGELFERIVAAGEWPAFGHLAAEAELATSAAVPAPASAEVVVETYLTAWMAFHPSRALALGRNEALRDLEDRSAGAIAAWVELNRRTLAEIETLLGAGPGPVAGRAARGEIPLSSDAAVDLRLVRAQVRRELAAWDTERSHERSLAVFVEPMAGALRPALESPVLSAPERASVLARRLRRMAELAAAARELVRDGRAGEVQRSLEELEAVHRELETALPPAIAEFSAADRGALEAARDEAIEEVGLLRRHVEEILVSSLTLPDSPILGRERYARGLALYTDSSLTPERLEELALAEIREAKRRIAELALLYWRESYPEEPLPEAAEAIVARAFADLEARRPETNAEYLETLREYRREAEDFVRERGIATVPEHDTLSLELAPESAGPMARVGYVSSAPPFAPNPWTTWYLATIPDTHPEEERVEFWRSFNYPFKKFIVIHELFPGHYLQLKILRENLHRARILFPWSPFTEGWATFSEEVAFEHGYAEGDRLVRLAQLRKRLENANRAYMSVQAHVNGWSEDRVFRTSVEMSLLAPQFAKSLWNRLMNWPFQMTTYMLGGLELQGLYEAEKRRLGPRFETRAFMDRVLRIGPVPVEEIGVFLELGAPVAAR